MSTGKIAGTAPAQLSTTHSESAASKRRPPTHSGPPNVHSDDTSHERTLRGRADSVVVVVLERTPYVVYVDEAGDRGWGGRSSPVFVLSAVVVKRSDDQALRDTLDEINGAMGHKPGHVLHWAENVREHSDRKMVASRLATLPATFINIVLCKDSLIGSGTRLSSAEAQYNYLVRLLLERVSWFMSANYGTPTLRFAHVRRFKYENLHDYLDLLPDRPNCNIKWWTLNNGQRPIIEQPQQRRGLQVADMLAGTVYAAVRHDRHGEQEPEYLRRLSTRLWTGPTNKLSTYGLKVVSANGHDCADHFEWLP